MRVDTGLVNDLPLNGWRYSDLALLEPGVQKFYGAANPAPAWRQMPHGFDSRPPILSNARKVAAEMLGDAVASALVRENPAAIVAGHPLPEGLRQ